ncbi:right-handed parallel beta-helix repeat-containing protein [Pseudoalteromonas rubra]|nr:right-handed parallel beta-helix repeat-containing protein [Pseudoalteromonas rubra]
MNNTKTFTLTLISGALALCNIPQVLAAEQCDVVIPSSHHLVDGDTLGIVAGDTVCLAAGERGPLRIRNVHGEAGKPVVFRNENGTVTTRPYEYSIAVEKSSQLRITGSRDEAGYGMRLGGTVGIGGLSEYIEIDNLEIYRARFAGLLIKTDPTCDPATWQENFTMRGLRVHHNYIHDTETGEGMYIGYTGKSRKLECDGVATTVYPHKLTDVDIYNNTLENIGADGIQLNSVASDATIRNNKIYRTGVSPFDPKYQNTGIQVGGDHVAVTGNLIYRSGGNGMMLDGDGLTIHDNRILYAGENGIFARNPAQQDSTVSGGDAHVYSENLIVHPGSYGIKLYATNTQTPNLIKENTVENHGQVDAANRPMTYSYLNNNVLRQELNNRHYVVEQ